MPLPDDKWAKGKCGLKGLTYMALEIPTVMSPVGVNTEIIKDGENGFLASTNNEWFEKLCVLIENPELRIKLGKAGRKTVVEKYSVQANKNKYLEINHNIMTSYVKSSVR
jgi:glycosyltransferase involved in cell wall biosynthesis